MNKSAAERNSPPAKQPAPVQPPVKPPAAKSAKPAKKRGGCFPIILLLVLIIALALSTVYYRRQVESLTGIKLPAFMHSTIFPQAAKPQPDAPAAAPPAPPPKQVVTVSAAQSEEIKNLTARLQRLQQRADVAKQEAQAMRAQLVRTEQQLSRLAAQVADINRQQTNSHLQLQLIDLHLQINGDTAAAAAQLRQLASAMEDTAAARAMLDAAARLDNLPRRAVLLSLLDELQNSPAAEQAADSAAGGIGAALKGLFNIRHTPTAAALSVEQGRLAQLQLLLLTRREDAYWRLLMQMRADGGGSREMRDILQRLYEYGAPGYRLALPELL